MEKEKLFGPSSDKTNKSKKDQNYIKISRNQCQRSRSIQIPNYHQFLSLYQIKEEDGRAELYIYNTENDTKEVKILNSELILDRYTSIIQLPNGELFCYGGWYSGTTVIIDRNYEVRRLPFGSNCIYSSALYFDNNIYCFGGYKFETINLSRKFDLEKNRWINLPRSPEADHICQSVIFNGNIMISGFLSKNLWIYSIELDSFSIIPYEFRCFSRKFLINAERLYLIVSATNLMIYESKDEYHWKPISESKQLFKSFSQMYWLYNKEKIYIATGGSYYQFDLKKKIVTEIK